MVKNVEDLQRKVKRKNQKVKNERVENHTKCY